MIFTAIYDFSASNSEEVSLTAGDLMTILDASDPDWSLVSLKSSFEAASGLVPKTYIEPAQPKYQVLALYDYTATNQDEVSITEGETFNVFLDDDPDWYWGTNKLGMDGLAPKNYFEISKQEENQPTDAHSQKNKLLNALDGFGFANTGPKKAPSDPKLELMMYLVVENDKKKKKKGLLGVSEDYMVSFVDEKSKKPFYEFHINSITFTDKKSKKLIINISQKDGSVETKEYEGDKSDIQGLMAQLTQCQSLYNKALASPKKEEHTPVIVPQVNRVELQNIQAAPKIVIALYDYTAADEEELSITENENMLVLDDSDTDWWLVRSMKKGGKEGFVPKTYVQLKQKPGDGIQTSSISNETYDQDVQEVRAMEKINLPGEPGTHVSDEAQRMQSWKELEEQRIRWERERFEQEEEELRKVDQMKREEEVRRYQEEEQRRSSQDLSVPNNNSPDVALRSEIPPAVASRPDNLPPIGSRPEMATSHFARPDISPPTLASRPLMAPRPDNPPPSIASRPEIAHRPVNNPPPIASRPEMSLPIFSRSDNVPPVAYRPEIAPPISSRPDNPPPIASRPEIAPPISLRPDNPPPAASRPDIQPPLPISSRPEVFPPSLSTRPSVVAAKEIVAPTVASKTYSTPAIPDRPSTEALGKSLGSEHSSSQRGPDIIREWTDKTGNFKIKAMLVNVIDNKVHLRKADTGGKITIQIEKLHPNDVNYIRSLPGYEHIAAKESAIRPTPQNLGKVSTVEADILAQAAAIKISDPSPNSFTYNGFNWKDWLIKAGVSTGDAISYGQRFCAEKLDSSSVKSLDRPLLRDLGVSEGDIIRIKRAVIDSISVEEINIAARELDAQNRNLEKIRKVSINRASQELSEANIGVNGQKQKQIESDEALARKLQFEEMQPQNKQKGGTFNIFEVLAQKSFSGNTVDLNAIKDVSVILEASNKASKSPPSVLRKSVTVSKNYNTSFSTPPSTEDAITNSLGISKNGSSSKHNPWSISGQESVQTVPIKSEAPSLPPTVNPATPHKPNSLPPPVIPFRPISNPNLVPSAQDALTKTQMQQKEAQLALQRAQYDLSMAQEQAKQAAVIQEQTKRAQAQEAESAIALAKAQETARQAAMIKEQSERALRAAQAGIVQPPIPNQNVFYGVGSGPLPPPMGPIMGQSYSTGPMNTFGARPATNFGLSAVNQPVAHNLQYQIPGSTTNPPFAPISSNILQPGSHPRPGLQAPLIPVNSSNSFPARPSTATNFGKSESVQSNNNDPYAVFRTANLNEPSLFTGNLAGPPSQNNYQLQGNGQNQMNFNPSMGNAVPSSFNTQGQMMPGQYRSMGVPGSITQQYSGFPTDQMVNSQNQMPASFANNQSQFTNAQMSNQFPRPPSGPNFMPPYNQGGYNAKYS